MIIFITLTNSGYIDYTLNCIKSIEKLNLNIELHSYCIGKEGYNRLISKNYKCSLIDNEKISNFIEFKTEKWSKITFNKFKIIYENLLKYDYVCITDGDIVFENPDLFNYLLENIEDNDMLIQNDMMDNNNNSNLCTGFIFIKSNDITKELFNPIRMQKNINIASWNDQLYVNKIKNELKYKMLPLDLFPNGQYYYKNSLNIKPYLIHFNHVVGHEKKRKMIEYNKWYL